MNDGELRSIFFKHVAQTSAEPMALVVESASGCTLRTVDGREFIDLLAGIGVAATGHGHPAVLAAVAEQAARHLHVMVYGELIQETQARLAERLAGLLPEKLSTVYFTNSGAEAVEGALKLVRKATGRARLLAFKGGFHGDTLGAVSVGGNPLYRDPFLPLLPEVGLMTFNDEAGLAMIDERVAAVIVEPVQAEAGVILPAPGFLAELGRRCTATGSLLVFDEVITGLGRTGSMFAFEHEGVVPDVLLLAKALGGGLPLGAFIASNALMRHLSEDPPLGHVTTFGGHPLSAAAGAASLEVIIAGELPERAERMGRLLATLLGERLDGGKVREIRRAGLLVGLEMSDAELAQRFTLACREQGLLVGWTLHDDRVLRLAPPLVISEAELDEATARMQRALP